MKYFQQFLPEWTATLRITKWLKDVICLGKETLFECPNPNRPFVPSPHAYIFPSWETEIKNK